MAVEISGDGGMTIAQRLHYLRPNLTRNLGRRSATFSRRSYCMEGVRRLYSRLLDGSLRLYRWLLYCATMVAVRQFSCHSGDAQRD